MGESMNFSNSVKSLLTVCLLPVWLEAQFVSLNPPNPRIGEPFTLKVGTRLPQPAKTMRVILYTRLTGQPDTLSMTPGAGAWQVSDTIEDTTVTALIFKITGIDSNNRTFVLDDAGGFFRTLINDADGRPVRGANLTGALLLGGFGGLQTANPDAAMKAVKKELALYPDNYEARLYEYTLMLGNEGLTDQTAFNIWEDIESVLSEKQNDPDALRFAVKGYRMIEADEDADQALQRLLKLDPSQDSQAVRQFNQIMAMDDLQEQTLQLEDFIAKYPGSRLREAALSQLASSIIELNDSTAMIRTGDRLFNEARSMAGASGLSAIAGVLAEKRWMLDNAQKYISRALEILDRTDPSDHPSEITDAEWQERINYTRTRYLDISGWIEYQKGNYTNALGILEKASENTMEPGILFHLAETLFALGEEEKAIALYARVNAFGGTVGEMAREKLDAVWDKSGRDPEKLEALLTLEEDQVEQAFEQKILNRRLSRPLPDFTMDKLSGGRISSRELRGSKVLLCFWATWSKGSADLIDALKEIAYARDDVLILAAAVDRDGADISEFVRSNRIPFQVLILNSQTEEVFNLQGVPVLYVVDSGLKICYYHKGYRPDIEDILNIELDSLD